jgi:hypothetical protein
MSQKRPFSRLRAGPVQDRPALPWSPSLNPSHNLCTQSEEATRVLRRTPDTAKTGSFLTLQNRPYNSELHPLQGSLGSVSGELYNFVAKCMTQN